MKQAKLNLPPEFANREEAVAWIVENPWDLEGNRALAGQWDIPEARVRGIWKTATLEALRAEGDWEPFLEGAWRAKGLTLGEMLEVVGDEWGREDPVEAKIIFLEEWKSKIATGDWIRPDPEEPEPPKADPDSTASPPLEAEVKPSEDDEEESEASTLWLPGVGGELQHHYLKTTMNPSPVLSLSPGITIAAVLTSACKVIGPTGRFGCPTHLTIVGLGGTGVGKQDCQDYTKTILKRIGMDRLLGPSRFKSGSAMIKFLKGNPVVVCVSDEFPKWLANNLLSREASAHDKQIIERMMELWSCQPGVTYYPAFGVDDGGEPIEGGVAFTLAGYGVPDDFFRVCKSEDITGGFLNRMLLLWEQGEIEENPTATDKPLEGKTFENLMKLAQMKAGKLEFGAGAEEIFVERKRFVKRTEDPTQKALWTRGPEQLVRLATGFAAMRFDPKISRSDMELALEVVRRSNVVFEKGIEKGNAERKLDHQGLVIEIERRIKKDFDGEATKSQIERTFRHNKSNTWAVSQALTDMVMTGTLVKEPRDTGGRPKEVYRLVG